MFCSQYSPHRRSVVWFQTISSWVWQIWRNLITWWFYMVLHVWKPCIVVFLSTAVDYFFLFFFFFFYIYIYSFMVSCFFILILIGMINPNGLRGLCLQAALPTLEESAETRERHREQGKELKDGASHPRFPDHPICGWWMLTIIISLDIISLKLAKVAQSGRLNFTIALHAMADWQLSWRWMTSIQVLMPFAQCLMNVL